MSQNVAALGLDIGSATTKLVGVDNEGKIVLSALEETEPYIERQTSRMLKSADAASGTSLVTTGYGRKLAAGSGRAVTEITCHARGVFKALGRSGTLIDIGGQDSKVIVLDEIGKVLNFAMNDKCAAGTGRFLENTAARLKIPLAKMAEMALQADSEVAISSTCTVFAESELVSLIARGTQVPHIVRGLHRALVRRVVALARSAPMVPPVFLSGGVSQSAAICRLLTEELAVEVEVPREPQLMGALGAALIALDS